MRSTVVGRRSTVVYLATLLGLQVEIRLALPHAALNLYLAPPPPRIVAVRCGRSWVFPFKLATPQSYRAQRV